LPLLLVTFLAAGTAAELGDSTGLSDATITVAIPNSAGRPVMPEGVRIVGSTEISELDLHPWAHPPRTRIARSLLDMTIESRRERRCRADLLAGCQ